MQRGILIYCWLGLAACSSETTEGDEAITDSEIGQLTESAQRGAGELPAATVTVEGATYEVSGNGFCRRIGSRSVDDPEGILEVHIKSLDNERFVQVLRGQNEGLLVAFHKTEAPLRSWSDSFIPEDDISEFDGRRFTFEGTVMAAPDEEQRTTMRVEVDCPFIEDLTTE